LADIVIAFLNAGGILIEIGNTPAYPTPEDSNFTGF
jgi:hypothetical protein